MQKNSDYLNPKMELAVGHALLPISDAPRSNRKKKAFRNVNKAFTRRALPFNKLSFDLHAFREQLLAPGNLSFFR